MQEKSIQEFICKHPYLIDEEILNCGKTEVSVSGGRIDITFQTEAGVIIIECKKTNLKDRDVKQIKKYIRKLVKEGNKVNHAYLIGLEPKVPITETLTCDRVIIKIKKLIESIPLQLAFCENGHYFACDFNICPYCSGKKLSGKEISLG